MGGSGARLRLLRPVPFHQRVQVFLRTESSQIPAADSPGVDSHRQWRSNFSKSETGVPIARYGRQLRLAEARELLRTTFLSVKEVAARVGVTGMSHFVRDFKKAYGSTPGRYVSRYRKVN
ncbi:MAG: helix-turn-helix transcriptional regulator [Chthoniobacterales bacterium]|nr:helix-turn-helix transcriptional regulator [Chthoniobacterales bacterium]